MYGLSRTDKLWLLLGHATYKVARAAQTPGRDVVAAVRAYQRLQRYWNRLNHGWSPKKFATNI
jgi:hypothetical protein